jgi:hypothetical protein
VSSPSANRYERLAAYYALDAIAANHRQSRGLMFKATPRCLSQICHHAFAAKEISLFIALDMVFSNIKPKQPEAPMSQIDGKLIRGGTQVAIRRKSKTSGAEFDTLMVARAGGFTCDPNAAFAMFSGTPDGSPISVDGDEDTCQGNLLVNKIL